MMCAVWYICDGKNGCLESIMRESNLSFENVLTISVLSKNQLFEKESTSAGNSPVCHVNTFISYNHQFTTFKSF